MNFFPSNNGINSSLDISQIQNIKEIEKLRLLYVGANSLQKFKIGWALYKRYKESGNISASIELLHELIQLKPLEQFIERELQINLDKAELLHAPNYQINYQPQGLQNFKIPFRVLHVLNTSIPYIKNGYSIRSKYIIENQKRHGIEPVVLTRPGFPNDFQKGLFNSPDDLTLEWENEIPYYRCLPKMFMRFTPLTKYLNHYSESIVDVIETERPGIVHAASNYINGLAAIRAARATNSPFIYEIRGFWELTASAKEPLFKDSEEFQLAQKMETYLAHQADHVITISRSLYNELLERGVSGDKISIIPNGVDSRRFKPRPVNEELSTRYDTKGKFVIGYIGSITEYEGLQMLFPVINELKKEGYQLKLLIIGTGNYQPILGSLITKLSLSKEIALINQIPHEQVTEYYSLFDLCVFPRIDEEVTQIVTPLKPLEAMACGKPVIGSDLAALREIIIPDENGLLYNLNETELYQKIKLLYENTNLRKKLASKARKWVIANRDWYKLTINYINLYHQIVRAQVGI